MQRFLDITLSGLALLALSPLLLPIALVLKLTGEGEIFYTQSRIGRGGAPFRLYKFATMLKNSAATGSGTITLKGDPRILPVGRFLRKSKINELPQLLNILLGDMSIVGPRPQTQRCFDAFPKASQRDIITVRPGLTGIGSIVFRREEDMMNANADPAAFYDHVIMPYKGRLEEWYVSHLGLRTYIMAIIVTAWVVVSPNSKLVWRAFPDLPPPPAALDAFIDYPASKEPA